jgi:hypothetical protein
MADSKSAGFLDVWEKQSIRLRRFPAPLALAFWSRVAASQKGSRHLPPRISKSKSGKQVILTYGKRVWGFSISRASLSSTVAPTYSWSVIIERA